MNEKDYKYVFQYISSFFIIANYLFYSLYFVSSDRGGACAVLFMKRSDVRGMLNTQYISKLCEPSHCCILVLYKYTI